MINNKLTIGEQAEQQSNAFNKHALSKVKGVPVGIGGLICKDCGCDIPMARRKAYGNGLCVDCAQLRERQHGN